MSNLNLMVGDWVKQKEIDFPFKVKEILKDKIVTTTLVYGVNVEILKEHIEPIPLTPSILEKIKGFGKEDIQTHLDGRTKEMFVYDFIMMNWYEDKKIFQCCPFGYPLNSSLFLHLHTLQQLIRLFTGKEIEIEWQA